MNYNIRSFFRHIDDFICILSSCNYDPDLIVLTETWLTDTNVDHANIEGYSVVHSIRQNANSGGVSIFYKKSLNIEKLDDFTVNNGAIETCSIKLRVEDSIIYCMGIYRPNTGTVTEFLQSLNSLFHKIQNLNKIKVILLGDFNINLILPNCHKVNLLCNFLRTYFFMPIVTNVTRYPANAISQPSLLDHVWINFVDCNYHSTVQLTDQTDHCPIIINVNLDFNREVLKKMCFRDHSISSISKLRHHLNLLEWNISGNDDVNEKMVFFAKTIDDLYNKYCPVKSKILNEKKMGKPWITPAIRNSIRTKSNIFKLYKRGIATRERNNQYKNLLYKTIRAAKRKYFHGYFQTNINNVKKSWDGIKKLMGNFDDRNGRCNRVFVLWADETIMCHIKSRHAVEEGSGVGRKVSPR